ncbi:MAG: metallophosphoesterase, partial [Gemmatimonadota bacterium]|nr:metallophosphoesterase [Gemmatimonadota bacterium]
MKIAHLADLHLGYRAFDRLNAQGVNVREADVAEAFAHAARRVMEIRPDLILIAGDLFNSVRPPNLAIANAFRQLTQVAGRLPDTPIVIISGSHDSPRPAGAAGILHLFREIPGVLVATGEPSRLNVPQLEACILCLPHANSADGPQVVIEPDSAANHNILLLHGPVSHRKGDETERWDYVALGHRHTSTRIAANVWYAGATERTSDDIWAEAEETKGFVVFDSEEGTAHLEEVETRPLVDLPSISARGLAAGEVDEAIRAAVEAISGGVAGKMVRQVVTDLPAPVLRELNHRRIREWKAAALHFRLDPRPPPAARGPERRTGA